MAADPLGAIFEHIDAAARNFKGMTADISNTEHHALAPDDDDVSTGTMKVLRVKPGLTRLLIDFNGARSLSFDGREGKMYNRNTKIVDVKDLGDKQSLIDQFLLLGFGATSAELQSTYDITYVGEETVGGQLVSHLKLVPKSPETKRTLKQAELWFAANGLVAQQKLLWAGGDYRLVAYSRLKLGPMPEKDLELKLPKGVIVQKH